jgi:hypothetical protein
MVTASDLIALWRRALDEGWGYIYGTAGETWTQSKQDKATREQTIKWGSKWIGKRVADCSGLAVWAFKQLGGNMYHGSNTIWNQYVTGRCALKNGQRTDGDPILPGDPVFLVNTQNGKKNRHHIGYYVGDGICIEAKGTYYGVVTSPLSHWHETAHWKGVEYEGGLIFVANPILRKGDTGEDVKKLQELLNGCGESLAVDGKFGEKTKKAVEDFQRLMGLQADGICGDQTWAALERAADPGNEDGYLEPPETVLHPPDAVCISRADFETITNILKKYGGK